MNLWKHLESFLMVDIPHDSIEIADNIRIAVLCDHSDAILMGVRVYFFYEDQYTKSEEAGLKALALLHGVENVLTSDTAGE